MTMKEAPASVIRTFLSVVDVLDIIDSSSSKQEWNYAILAKRAFEVGEYPLSLRMHEAIYRTGVFDCDRIEGETAQTFENLLYLYSILSFPAIN